jgi:hypothetical protein
MNHNVVVAVILHDFEYLDLMCFETPTVAVDEITEEVKQLALVVAVVRLFLNILTNLFNQLKHCHLIIKHCLVIIVHLLQEVNTSHIPSYVMNQHRNMPLHYCLYLIEVLNQSHYEIVTHMQQFYT